jgi:hypothetical protein
MMKDARDTIWKTAIMWYGVEVLPVMRAMTRAELMAVMQQANEHSMREPLHLCGAELRFSVPLWSAKPLSAAHVVALMVFGLWVIANEDEAMASGLVKGFEDSIKPALPLTQNADGTKQVGFYRAPEQDGAEPVKNNGRSKQTDEFDQHKTTKKRRTARTARTRSQQPRAR